MDDRNRGLYGKFYVERTDGKSAPGEKHHECEYFVLDLHHDKHAVAAIRAYVLSCRKEFPALADDLIDKIAEVNALCDMALDALRSEKPAIPEESGWVIERGSTSAPEYWTGWSGKRAWESDNSAAIRFARRQDATNVLCFLMPNEVANVRICEHIWCAAAPTVEERKDG